MAQQKQWEHVAVLALEPMHTCYTFEATVNIALYFATISLKHVTARNMRGHD